MQSQTELELLELFCQALTNGDQSVLYKSLVDSKTREIDSGATSLASSVFLENSPNFPAVFVQVSGIPGNQITIERVEQLRRLLLDKIAQIAKYTDGSTSLAAFNQMIIADVEQNRRYEGVWVKDAPLFGLYYGTAWKEQLNYLEMDHSFIRSLTEESTWSEVERRLKSGTNVWRDLIERSHLTDVPYANASVPSPQQLEDIEKGRQTRIREATSRIVAKYSAKDEQQALARFEQDESAKTNEIDKMARTVPRPRFTSHPPLTLDDKIRYKQFQLESVPAVAALFDRVRIIDLGLAFDLRRIPQKYYKYLTILPGSFNSLGLKTKSRVTSYSELSIQIQKHLNDFSIAYESNPVSGRADLTFRASTSTAEDFRGALSLIQQIMASNYLDISNVDRLRDLVDRRIAADDAWDKRANPEWFVSPIYAFRYQQDPLYLALNSPFTRIHWDSRLKWLLHTPVSEHEINELGRFAQDFLQSCLGMSAKDISQKIIQATKNNLQGELLTYWQKNIPAFPEQEILIGLKQLTEEVAADLKQGSAKTIEDIRELQRLVLDRQALSIDITADERVLDKVEPALRDLVRSISVAAEASKPNVQEAHHSTPVISKLEKRYGLSGNNYPWYVEIEDPRSTLGSVGFYADFPGYANTDRKSLLKVLSSKILVGAGPQTAFVKARDASVAYDSNITTNSTRGQIWYYAERCPDIPVLVEMENSTAHSAADFHDPFLVDYALEHTFAVPRSMSTFAERGRAIARDLRDGNDPDKVRRFSEGILKLREDPNLLNELTHGAMEADSPVLIDPAFVQQQRAARTVFMFVGPQRILADAEKGILVPKLFRLYSSDFWLDVSENTFPTK